jgi:hypothetical protein
MWNSFFEGTDPTLARTWDLLGLYIFITYPNTNKENSHSITNFNKKAWDRRVVPMQQGFA